MVDVSVRDRQVIRTPDQRLRVFVSSTLQELAEERAAAREAITHLRLAPVLFELGARPHPPRELYRAYLEQSHIFIGVYWQRYGWVAPGMDISGLEDEYHLSGDKPKLIYLKTPAPAREPHLQTLLDYIRDHDGVSYKYFSTAAELRELIENDLALLLTERFEMAQAAPAARPAGARVHNLPAPPTPLIGRETEAAAARDLLLRDDVRLVTLTGPGGTGKTRLSIEVAKALLDRFDGAYFVNLAAITNPDLVPLAIAQAVDIREASDEPLEKSLKDYLRDKQALLVLDNFEQVVAAAPLVADLLRCCARLKLMVTSRTPLHVRGEQEFPVPPLALPDPNCTDDLLQYPSIALFVRRAQDVKPGFALTEENAAAVAEICRRLDGLPLAIELAAARIKLLSPQAMLARLERRLPMLTGGARDLPDRQRTMRDTIAWSYDLLDECAATLFRRLAVFVGGCTLDAVEAVCNTDGVLGEDVFGEIEPLVDKSLLRWEESVDGEPRFEMLQTIREYALEQLIEAGEEPVIRRKHADFYLRLAEAAEPHLTSGRRKPWLARLEAELDNLRAVLEWSRSEPQGSQTALGLAGALAWFWYFRGLLGEGRSWLEKALWRAEVSDRAGASQEAMMRQAKALHAAGSLAWYQGDFVWARERLEESVALWRELRDHRGVAYALMLLGMNMFWKSDQRTSRAIHAESVALFREVGDKWGLALALFWMATAETYFGNMAVRAELEESLALFRELGDKWGVALALQTLGGDLAYQEGDYPRARALLEESLASFREMNDRWLISVVLMKLGDVVRHQGDYAHAEVLHQESLTLRRQMGNKYGIASSLRCLAVLAQDQGDYARATRLYKESLTLRMDVRYPSGIAGCLEGLAGVAGAQGRFDYAARLLGQAEMLRQMSGTPLALSEHAAYAHTLGGLRAGLDEATLAALWEEGRGMRLELAVAYALGGGD